MLVLPENLVVLIIIIFATTGEVEALLPVIGMLLQFSPKEVKFSVCIRCLLGILIYVMVSILFSIMK